MAECRLKGEVASGGIAIGPVVRLADLMAAQPVASVGTPETEHRRLTEAMEQAGRELQALRDSSGPDAAEILEFQTEMLADPALVEETLAAVDAGTPAAEAWRLSMDSQILAYAEADDEYFRARSADLGDLRDRVLAGLHGRAEPAAAVGEGAILLARDIGPSRFIGLDWKRIGGVALEAGSPTSHVAMLARARGVPLVTGLGDVFDSADLAILDGSAGLLILRPDAEMQEDYRRQREEAARRAAAEKAFAGPARLRSGERVLVLLNVDEPSALDDALLARADGVGLWRTEFLFLGHEQLPDEDTQYAVYAGLLRRAAGKPVTLRTLDIGGDKPLPGLDLPPESNPFLGLRGIRLCLERPDLFRPQVRALLRAAALGPVKVMLPMIAHPDEIAEAQALFAAELRSLTQDGTAAALPTLGIMIEVPSAAITIERFAEAAFFSIGSNDLTQYVMAASRDASGRVARLADPTDPAVLQLIERVAAYGRAAGKEVSVCGDMGSDPAGLTALLEIGIRSVSIAPAAFGRVRGAIAAHG
jgi:phosphotransferase system enzyme I (PtsI)